MFAKVLGTEMSLYVQITYGLVQSDALAYRTYHEFERPYCDYLR